MFKYYLSRMPPPSLVLQSTYLCCYGYSTSPGPRTNAPHDDAPGALTPEQYILCLPNLNRITFDNHKHKGTLISCLLECSAVRPEISMFNPSFMILDGAIIFINFFRRWQMLDGLVCHQFISQFLLKRWRDLKFSHDHTKGTFLENSGT